MHPSSRNEGSSRIRRIMVATDFSTASAAARDYATALAEPGDTLMVVHSEPLPLPDWPEPAYVPDWMPAEPSVRECALERMREFAALPRAAGLFVNTVLADGLPADVILAQAARMKPDLIAMGTHGRHGFDRWVMGSVAERVASLAHAPVLTVSAARQCPSPPIRHVLCPASFEASPEVLAYASEVAHRCGSLLSIMHVVEDAVGPAPADWCGRWARDRLCEALNAAGPTIRVQTLLGVGSPAHEILRVVRDQRVDLIVMGLHGVSQRCRRLFSSTAAQIVREAGCGVITIRSSEIARNYSKAHEASRPMEASA